MAPKTAYFEDHTEWDASGHYRRPALPPVDRESPGFFTNSADRLTAKGNFPCGPYLSHFTEVITRCTYQLWSPGHYFYRDDFNKGTQLHVPNETAIDFSIENKKVILVDDVLYTGRTTRSALDAMLDYGRPSAVELLVLIDRRFTRQLPIQADYTGRTIDAIISDKVKVLWKERDGKDEVIIE